MRYFVVEIYLLSFVLEVSCMETMLGMTHVGVLVARLGLNHTSHKVLVDDLHLELLL